jgi:SAM-dependent methyltransferase
VSLITTLAQATWKVSTIGLPKGEHFTRYNMYKSLQTEPVFAASTSWEKVLSISHSLRLCEVLGVRPEAIVQANYPEQKINALKFDSNYFSAVVSDQVLEHIECNPCEAVNEVHRVLEPGGIAVHTTCFMMAYHGSPDYFDLDNGDFWRFTPSGLARLHKNYSQIIRVGGWGNTMVPLVNGLGLTWMPVPEAKWHPLNFLARTNRRSYAHVVWVIARK